MTTVLDPTDSLREYPMPLSRYGLNPYGDPKYRIVFAQSRRKLVGGTWGDNGATEYRWTRTYPQVKDPWVLEAWSMPNMTRARWDAMVDPQSGWLINGPYPDRGDYWHAHTFTCAVADCNFDKLIAWIEAGKRYSYQENLVACRDEYAKEEEDKRKEGRDRIENALPAFLDRPMVGFGGGRGTKTASVMLDASQVRLPGRRHAPVVGNRAGSKFITAPRKPKARVTL